MLRLTCLGLSLFSKTGNKVPYLAQRLNTNMKLKFSFSAAKFTSEFNAKLASGKYYEVLGYPQGTDPNSLTDAEVKRQYLAMVKKYHSDGVIDPVEKKDNQEITKCIIQAFDKISSDRIRTQIDKGIYDKIYQDEDEIAMKIYGKKFDEIKYDLFKEGNAAKRAEFMEELQKIRRESKYYSHGNRQAQQAASSGQQQSYSQSNINIRRSTDSSGGIMKFVLPVVGVIAALALYYENQKKEQAELAKAQRIKSKHTLGEEKIKEIQRKSTELYERKLTDLIDSYVEEQPPCLKYPQKEDPEQIEQLVEFTIGPDINLYQVSSKLMAEKGNLEKLKSIKSAQELKQEFGPEFDPFPLTKIKTNSAITLSLQAERCLQNIYVKVKDVADQIEETGKYVPPKVFFRFFGYLMFEIREKPLSLDNYRETEYVSLFDLFFNYYSPIPVKRHEYNQYLVGFKDQDMKMYGQVHINNRKIPERFIGRHDKVVVMKDDSESLMEKKNQEIWHDYYRKYMKIWMRGYSDRISTEHA